MKKRGRREHNGPRAFFRGRLKIIMAFCLVLTLFISGAILAQQGRVKPTSKPTNDQGQSPPASPSSFTPNAPMKEYIYVGGKLVATEGASQ